MRTAVKREPAEGDVQVEAVMDTGPGSAPAAGARSLPTALRAGAPTWIWLGVAAVVAGFALLALAWGQMAAENQVYRQVPYLVSAGLVGLAMIMTGLTALAIATRQRDAIDRDRQIDRLAVLLEELNQVLGDHEDGHR